MSVLAKVAFCNIHGCKMTQGRIDAIRESETDGEIVFIGVAPVVPEQEAVGYVACPIFTWPVGLVPNRLGKCDEDGVLTMYGPSALVVYKGD